MSHCRRSASFSFATLRGHVKQMRPLVGNVLLHRCCLFHFLLWRACALLLPQPGDSSAALHFKTARATDFCFATAYASFDNGNCFTYTATIQYEHALALTRCHHAAFHRTLDPNTSEFFATATAFTLHL